MVVISRKSVPFLREKGTAGRAGRLMQSVRGAKGVGGA